MDYLNLLPPNIHQDIVERVDVDKPFDLNIENGYYIPNYYHFIFSRLLKLPEDINRVLTLSINGINYIKKCDHCVTQYCQSDECFVCLLKCHSCKKNLCSFTDNFHKKPILFNDD